jgi:hypothetical protein
MNGDGTSPQLARPGSRVRDRRGSRHAWSLRRVQVERVAGDNAYAVIAPVVWRNVAHRAIVNQLPVADLIANR